MALELLDPSGRPSPWRGHYASGAGFVMTVDATGKLVGAATPYGSPDGRKVQVSSNMGVLFSDDFGGSAVDPARWDVIPGGLPAIVAGATVTVLGDSPTPAFSQAAIGSGVSTGMSVSSVAASALNVAMGTTNGAELWLLSRAIFAGSEDVLVTLSKTQANTSNSIFVGLVEVDLATGIPLLNPNLAGDFTNRGGVELGATAAVTTYTCQAVADSSPNVSSGTAGVAAQTFVTGDEVYIEFHAEDIIGSTSIPDGIAAKASTPARVSTQCPNDGKAYKLLFRFRNTGVPTATTVTIQRALVVDTQENRVEVTSGRGDSVGAKALPVNVATPLPTGTLTVGGVFVRPTTSGGLTSSRILAALTGVIKATAGQIYGWSLLNTTAAIRYLHIYAKTTAPVVGTDTPILTIPLAANGQTTVTIDPGAAIATGMSWAITTDNATIPATAGTAGDVVGTVFFI